MKTSCISKTMKDTFLNLQCYWHTITGNGGDPFDQERKEFPWAVKEDPNSKCKRLKMRCCIWVYLQNLVFHITVSTTSDLIGEVTRVEESGEKDLDFITDYAKKKQAELVLNYFGERIIAFSNPRYMKCCGYKSRIWCFALLVLRLKMLWDATIKLRWWKTTLFWGVVKGICHYWISNWDAKIDSFLQIPS